MFVVRKHAAIAILVALIRVVIICSLPKFLACVVMVILVAVSVVKRAKIVAQILTEKKVATLISVTVIVVMIPLILHVLLRVTLAGKQL